MNITRPTLLLDEKKMINNLDQMLAKAKATNTELIPHFKTHQSKEIGELYRSRGIKSITVSSVKMAQYFAQNGWKDITVAFPFNCLEIPAVNDLLANGIDLKILVTEKETLERLSSEIKNHLGVMIEIDAGYGRSGVPAADRRKIESLVEIIEATEHLSFYGLYCHSGNTYHVDSRDEIKNIWSAAIQQILDIKDYLGDRNLKIRMGDTPGCSVVDDMLGVDEIGPGNFIFYDLVMNYLNVCDESDIAVAVACPVVAKNESDLRLVVHGGAVHFSKDHLFGDKEQKFFGEMVILTDQGWSSIIPEAKLISVSQEHGIIQVDADTFQEIQVGDVVGVLPIHSCLTANLIKEYHTFDGKIYEHLEKVF